MKGIKAKVVKVISDEEIMIDRKIRGTNLIRIKGVSEMKMIELKGKVFETFKDEISEIIILGKKGKVRRIILD